MNGKENYNKFYKNCSSFRKFIYLLKFHIICKACENFHEISSLRNFIKIEIPIFKIFETWFQKCFFEILQISLVNSEIFTPFCNHFYDFISQTFVQNQNFSQMIFFFCYLEEVVFFTKVLIQQFTVKLSQMPCQKNVKNEKISEFKKIAKNLTVTTITSTSIYCDKKKPEIRGTINLEILNVVA